MPTITMEPTSRLPVTMLAVESSMVARLLQLRVTLVSINWQLNITLLPLLTPGNMLLR